MVAANHGPMPVDHAAMVDGAPETHRLRVGEDRTLLGLLLLTVAGVWMIASLGVLLGAQPLAQSAFAGLGAAGAAGVFVIGSGLACLALDLVLHRRTLTVTEDVVTSTVRRLGSVQRWCKPRASFRELRYHREAVRHRYGWRVRHRIELVHRDPKKSVCLLSTWNENQAAACWRRWAAQWGQVVALAGPGDPPSNQADPMTPRRLQPRRLTAG